MHVCLFECVLGRKEETGGKTKRVRERQTDILLFSGRLCFCREVPKKKKKNEAIFAVPICDAA